VKPARDDLGAAGVMVWGAAIATSDLPRQRRSRARGPPPATLTACPASTWSPAASSRALIEWSVNSAGPLVAALEEMVVA
jgi:hypothetical protein